MKKACVLSYPLSAQQRLIRLVGCLGWSESLQGAHAVLLVLSCADSYGNICNSCRWPRNLSATFPHITNDEPCTNGSSGICRQHVCKWILRHSQIAHAQMDLRICADSACTNGSSGMCRQRMRKWVFDKVKTVLASANGSLGMWIQRMRKRVLRHV